MRNLACSSVQWSRHVAVAHADPGSSTSPPMIESEDPGRSPRASSRTTLASAACLMVRTYAMVARRFMEVAVCRSALFLPV